jgi:FMN-dependent NADH-azoreductase
MQNVLLILSSPRGSHSYSHQVARRVVDDIKARFRGATVVVRDLARQPLPHISEAFTYARAAPVDALRPAERDALARSDALVAELQRADVVVLAAPMHNFGIPSCLKAWIDHIVRPGVTFRYGASGPEGLLTGKKAIVVVARGGVYSEGPMTEYDFQEPYLRKALGFIGIKDVEVVRIEGVGFGPDALQKALATATAAADAAVGTLADAVPVLSEAA